MTIFLFTIAAFAMLRKIANKPTRRTYTAVSPAEIQRQQKEREKAQREAEKARKAQQARAQAQMELDHIEAQREQLMYLYDALEAERDADSTTQSRKNSLTRQLIGLEEKLYKLDARKAKAYNTALAV